ncbi:MAG TPA: DinB family protein [Gemmatimonadaceae bacterium]|nr:DinB family protein [Gemmatimonadaceae bacterium]
MSVEYFTKLLDHMEWADKRALASLRAMSNPPPVTVELFAHIVGAERVWLSRIEGSASPLPTWPKLTLGETEKVLAGNVEGYRRILSGLSSEGLQQPITYKTSAGDQFTSTIEDILTQVLTHSAYHRGQIAAQVRAAGGTPNPTDYIAYIRGAPAATRQP